MTDANHALLRPELRACEADVIQCRRPSPSRWRGFCNEQSTTPQCSLHGQHITGTHAMMQTVLNRSHLPQRALVWLRFEGLRAPREEDEARNTLLPRALVGRDLTYLASLSEGGIFSCTRRCAGSERLLRGDAGAASLVCSEAREREIDAGHHCD